MGALMKLAQTDLNVYTAGFLRFFFGLVIIGPYILKSKLKVYQTKNFKVHLIRSSLNLPAMLLGFAALTMVPLEKITVLEYFGYNLWKGNHPYAKENSIVEGSMIVDEELRKKIDKIKIDKFYRINYDDIFKKLAIKNIKEDPLGHLVFYLKKAFSYVFINLQSADPKYWNIFHYIPVLIFGVASIIGIILADKKSHHLNYLILIFFVNIIIFSTVSILPRYKLVILPLQIIFTNVLIEKIKDKFFKK